MKIAHFARMLCVVLVLVLTGLGGCSCDEDPRYDANANANKPVDAETAKAIEEASIHPFTLTAAYPSTGANLTMGIPLSGMKSLFAGLTIPIGESCHMAEDYSYYSTFSVIRTAQFSEDIYVDTDGSDFWQEIYEGEATLTISGTYFWRDGTIADGSVVIMSSGTHTSSGGHPGTPTTVQTFEGSYGGSFFPDGSIAEPKKSPPEGTTIKFNSSGPSTFTESFPQISNQPNATGDPTTSQDTIWFGAGLPFVANEGL